VPDLALFAQVFAIIFIAELPDKTALASLVLATRYRPLAVFVGAALALTVQSVVAVAAGRLFALLPDRVVHVVSGVVFLLSAVWMWLRKQEAEEKLEEGKPAGILRAIAAVFLVVFIAEWGDLTQIGTAALAAKYADSLLTVFTAATLALWSVVAIAVFVGNRAGRLLDPHRTQRIAAVLFAIVGVLLILGVV
jgi:Ca2+/H+ antiporter, TMEM165/GDT1 family